MIWTEEMIKKLYEYYPNNGSYFVSNMLNIDIKKIRSKVSKLGLTISNVRKHQKRGHYKKNYNVMDITDYMNNTNSYILGILWTDGYIVENDNMIGISLIKEDMDEIEWMFNLTGKWHAYDRKRDSRKITRMLTTYNPILLNSLMSLDFKLKSKLSPHKIWNMLNDIQRKYFFRGIIDGDGCFYYNPKLGIRNFIISSTYDQNWNLYENIFNKLNCKYSIQRIIRKNGNKSSCIRITSKSDINRLINWVYDDYEIDNIGLKRKFIKSNEMK